MNNLLAILLLAHFRIPSLQQEDIPGSQLTWCPPKLPGPSQSCFSPEQSPWICTYLFLLSFACFLAEFDYVPVSPFPQPSKVLLDSSNINSRGHSPSSVSSLLRVLPHHPIIKEKVEQDWSQYQSLAYSTSDCPPTRPHATDHHPVGLDIQSILNSLHYLLIQPLFHKILYKDLLGEAQCELDVHFQNMAKPHHQQGMLACYSSIA